MDGADLDLLMVGAGPTGLACAIEAKKAGLRALVVEKGCIVNSIFNYPRNMVFFTTSELLEIGGLPFPTAQAKPTRAEALEYYRRAAARFDLDIRQYERIESITPLRPGFEVRSSKGRYRAGAVVIATGYYDLPNLMGIPGEDLPHVFHYFQEAHAFSGLDVAIIGGKNFAAETALDLYRHGARVTLVHRQAELGKSIKYWVRPDIENRINAGEIHARFSTQVLEILPGKLRLASPRGSAEMRADFVFALTGYHPDFDFLRAAGVALDENQRPACDPATYETNVPDLYLGGVVVAGRNTSEIFIENGRFHGQVIVAHILAKRAAPVRA
ncbi:MAG TPA: YpdA family putative bacillithiol disulfide reductase [Terriglobales bacterium]|nr:YpdA family putative bacillithiol disulfide reductase [Terriglobales bacterium]